MPERPFGSEDKKPSFVERSWKKLALILAAIGPLLTIVATQSDNFAKIAKSGKDICEALNGCTPARDTIIIQAPTVPLPPDPAPSRQPVEPAIVPPDRDPVISAALAPPKPTLPVPSPRQRDTTFDPLLRARIVTVTSNEKVLLCGRPEMVVIGPDLNGTNQVHLRQIGLLPSERRDIALNFNTVTNIQDDCAVRVSRSADEKPFYSFEEIPLNR